MRKLLVLFFSCCLLIGCGSEQSYRGVSLTQQQVQHLHAFARLYGYMRYFYPGSTTRQVDWDRLAVYGAQQVMAAKDKQALQQVLQQLFTPLAPLLRISSTGTLPVLDTNALLPPDTSGYRLSYWQHNGITNNAFNVTSFMFQSQLLNQPNKILRPNNAAEYGVISSLPIHAYRGKIVKLSASLQYSSNGTQGEGVLFAQPGAAGGAWQSSTRMKPGARAAGWHRYEILLRLTPNADSLCIGCFVKNGGSVKATDFLLQVEGDKAWQSIPLPNAGFTNDTAGRLPKGWRTWPDGFTTVQVVEEKQANSVRHVVQIQAMPSQSPFSFRSLPLYAQHPPFGSCIRKNIGSGISICLPQVLYVRDGRTYPAADSTALQQLLATLNQQEVTASAPYTRLADIIISWNLVQHSYPYLHAMPVNWEALLDTLLQRSAAATSSTEHINNLKWMMAHLKDYYTSVAAPGADLQRMGYLPVEITCINNQLLVSSILNRATADGLQPGDVILQINRTPAMQWLQREDSLLSFGNERQKLLKELFNLQYGDIHSGIQLTVKQADGHTKETVLPYEAGNNIVRNRYATIRELKPGTWYLPIAVLSSAQLDSFFTRNTQARYLVWDTRGLRPVRFLQHLLPITDTVQWLHVPQINYPDQDSSFGWEAFGWKNLYSNWKPLPTLPHAQHFFLCDRNSTDYEEISLGYIKHYHLGTIVGQPTAGCTGTYNGCNLPGGAQLYFNAVDIVAAGGSPLSNVGVQPDKEVWPSMAGIRAQKDEVLDAALAMIPGK